MIKALIFLFVVIYMAVTSAWSGGSLYGHKFLPKWAPEALFALPFGLVWLYILGPGVTGATVAVLFFICSYAFQQSGTWIMLPWFKKGVRDPDREATLRPISDWIAGKLNIEFDSVQYARIYAALKGFLITLPVGGTGALTWMLGHEMGARFFNNNNTVKELLSGAGAGISILIFLVTVLL